MQTHVNDLQMQRWGLMVLGLGLAVGIGYLVGTGAAAVLVLVAAVVALLGVVVGLQARAWVLIVLMWSLAGYTTALPIPISGRDVAILLAGASFLGYRILTGRSHAVRRHPLDLILYANLGYLVFTFVLNPVGFRSLGADTIGGRPYFNIAMAAAAYWLILRLPARVSMVARLPLYMLVGVSVVTILHVISYFFPEARTRLSIIYAALDVTAFFAGAGREAIVPRYGQLGVFGMYLMFVLCAYHPPHTLFHLHRPRGWLFVFAWFCTLMSGFRSYVLWSLATVLLGSWLHRGWRQLAPVLLAGSVALGVVLAGQGRLYELPLSAQRSLSWLPGQWATVALDDAESSSQSRFRWWLQLIREGAISNWVFGDGFGFSKKEAEMLRYSGDFYENQTLYGGFHNGPLSTVRFTGVVGLLLLYALMISAAAHAVRCVVVSRGKVLAPAAIFVAIQCVWWPVHYTFVFGAYDSHLPHQIFLVGLLRLLQEKLAEHGTTAAGEPAAAQGVA